MTCPEACCGCPITQFPMSWYMSAWFVPHVLAHTQCLDILLALNIQHWVDLWDKAHPNMKMKWESMICTWLAPIQGHEHHIYIQFIYVSMESAVLIISFHQALSAHFFHLNPTGYPEYFSKSFQNWIYHVCQKSQPKDTGFSDWRDDSERPNFFSGHQGLSFLINITNGVLRPIISAM